MRIRKTLAKALGQLRPYTSPQSDTVIPSSFSNTSVGGSSGLSCQLNQSPWDVYPNHRYFRSTFKCLDSVESLPNPKEEHEDITGEISEHEKDVLGKSPTMETIEEKPLLSKRVNAQSKSKKKGDTVKKENNEIIMCKKNDGRNWFCKNPAKLPHNLCEHHLTLSRSYKEPSGLGVGGKTKREKETKDFNSDYYYYDTVMPSGGKRRRARNADNGSNVMEVEEATMEKTDVLGGDEEDEVEVLDHKVAVSGSIGEKKVKIGAKKPRKLVKYRSLDSLPVAEP